MRYARPLIAGSATVLAATVSTTVAFAATTWTVTPGGAITATGMKVVSTFPLSPKQKITSP
jgi:hypothetical protein